jgi:hypothetical protein
MDAKWPGAVAFMLHQSHPVRYKNKIDGGLFIVLECSTCSKEEELHLSKRLPPEAIAKKARRIGWDIRKRRCPACAQANRRVKRPKREIIPPAGTLQTEIERVFASRDEPLPLINIGEHMDAKIGINDRNVTFVVPKESKFIDAFMDENFKAKSVWSIDLVQESPQEEPLVRLQRKKLPPGKEKVTGLARGSYDSSGCLFSIVMKKGTIKGSSALGEFRTTEARLVRQDSNSYFFKLPINRQPPIVRRRTTAKVPTTGIETLKRSIEPIIENKELSEDTTISTETKKISLKTAVEILNKHKDRLGDELILSITSNGKIKAMIEYGDHE